MDVTAAPATTSTAKTIAKDASETVISSDFDTFLQMMTAQIQNQDPLNPVDSADYAVQLATFSSVEQQVLTNQLLENLIQGHATSGMAEMAAWVGKEARAPVDGYFNGAPITVAPNPVAIADSAELIVRDSFGNIVQRQEIQVSADSIEWGGFDESGTPLPHGAYSFHVASYSGGELLMEEQADIYSTVREVRSENDDIVLVLDGDVTVSAQMVSALRSNDGS